MKLLNRFRKKREPKLTIELVPETAWYSNLRSELSKSQWDRIRKDAYRKAGYRCEICKGKGEQWPVECHERWEYIDETHTQILLGTVALCPDCHRVKHIGYAGIIGKEKEAVDHLCKINGWSVKEALIYVNDAFEKWEERSNHLWITDLSWLEFNYNIRVTDTETLQGMRSVLNDKTKSG